MTDSVSNLEINYNYYFPCGVYTFRDNRFIDEIFETANDYLRKSKKKFPTLNPTYPVRQTESFHLDNRIIEFKDVLNKAAYKILENQGTNMSLFDTTVTELWYQEHHKNSSHDVHIHGNQGQLCGFYFLENEKDSVRALVHDPKSAKVYASLPQADENKVTVASNIINFAPEPGLFMLINTWMPHSFTRNTSSKPFKFIHFNINVIYNPKNKECQYAAPEII